MYLDCQVFFEELGSLNRSYNKTLGGSGEEDQEGDNGSVSGGFEDYWSWHLTLDAISNHDRTKWEYFFKMNVIEFLNCISFYKEKQEWEFERQQEAIRNANR